MNSEKASGKNVDAFKKLDMINTMYQLHTYKLVVDMLVEMAL